MQIHSIAIAATDFRIYLQILVPFFFRGAAYFCKETLTDRAYRGKKQFSTIFYVQSFFAHCEWISFE